MEEFPPKNLCLGAVKEFSFTRRNQIDSLLAANRMPIVVGGTNYYIESILWRVLLGASVKRERVRLRSASEPVDDVTEPAVKQPKPDGTVDPEHTLERLLEDLPTMGCGDALEVHGSVLLHRVLQRVDPDSADRLHPNNKRKIIRTAGFGRRLRMAGFLACSVLPVGPLLRYKLTRRRVHLAKGNDPQTRLHLSVARRRPLHHRFGTFKTKL
uniref:Uncharacterized protein n=1 Tax=Anopheles maculatus TaxID=74869 RepID=A0A182S6Z6_9DIPT